MTEISQKRSKTPLGLIMLAIVLALVLGGLSWWLVAGDQAFGGVLPNLSSETTEDKPTAPTIPLAKGTITKTVAGAGEVKGSDTEKLKPGKWRYFASFDAPTNKLVRAGETLMTYTSGDVMEAPYDLVVKSHSVPKAREELSQDEHYVEVERMDTVHITMPVPESNLASLAEGQEVNVEISGQEPRKGVISNIDQVGAYNASGSKFTVTISVENDGSIWLGMSAALAVKVAEVVDVLLVPVSAVQGAGSAKTVTVQSADGTLRDVPVTTGLSDGGLVEITGELQEGDLIVLHEAGASGAGSGVSAGTAAGAGAGAGAAS